MNNDLENNTTNNASDSTLRSMGKRAFVVKLLIALTSILLAIKELINCL